MTKQTEALKLALEAITTYLSESPDPSEEAVEGLCDAKALIAKALAEQPAQRCWKCGDMDVAFQMKCTVPACGMKEQPAQPQQEPVAWAMKRADGLILDVICPEEHESHEGEYTIPLYGLPSVQRVWIGLTDDERANCWSSSAKQSAINIEAKLKEKNT